MNKKFIWIIISVLLWFFIIAGLAVYYIFSGNTSVDPNENKPSKELTELVTSKPVEAIKQKSVESKNLQSEKPKENLPKIETIKNESIVSNKSNITFEVKKAFETTKEPSEVKPDLKIQTPIIPEKTEEVIGGIRIVGNVIDLKTDQSIAGVNVSFYSSDGQFLKRETSDKNGRFEAKGVKANAIHIRLQKEHYINGVFKNYSIDDLSQHMLFKMDPGLAIKGMVKDKLSGLALVGVSVEMYRGNTILKKGESSDEKGCFSVDAVPQGNIELVFTKLGYTQTSQTLNIEKAPISNLEILLEKSSSLLVEVVTIGGFVEIPKIKVYFDSNQDAKIYERSILTQDQGKNLFRIPGIDRQYSKLRVNAEGFTLPAEKPLTIVPGQETIVVFEVDKGLTVRGSIHRSNGSPLSDVAIKLYEVFGGGRAVGDDVLKGTSVSDKNGKFMVSGITPGNIEIVTSSTVYKRYQKKFLVEEKNNPEIEILLEVENFFTGSVSDTNGQPVNISEVRFVPIKSDGTFDSTRDRPVFESNSVAGEFRMSGVSVGLYRLSITASGYIAFIDDRYVVKTDQNTGEFKLIKGMSVTGDVKNESGAPIVEVEVRLLVSVKESNVKYRSTTDFNGFFAVSGLEENVTYKMQVQGKGYQLYEKEILVKSGSNNYPIVLTKKMSFSGVVLDGNTQLPIQNFQIKILGKFSQGLLDDSSESFNVSNGQFNIPVNAEVFNLEIKAPGFALYHLKNIKITDPIKNHYLIKAGSVNIKLLLGKEPGSMRLIQVSMMKDIDSDEAKCSARTDTNGNAIFQNLKPGSYFIRVSGVQGFANYDDILNIQEEVELKKNIVLIPGLSVKGRLLNSLSNIPISSGEVYLDIESYIKFPQKVYLDPDGFFNFKNVNVGKHTITIKYGVIVNTKFSQSTSFEITVPGFVNNQNGVYQLDDILVK